MQGVIAALCTCLLGLGLARFAYTPLIPALIGAHWFTAGQAAYLGAANIGGYLAGALAARAVARCAGVRLVLRLCLVLATAQFFACMYPAGFAWFVAWRLLSGLAGAGLMVLAAPSVLPLVPAKHRGLAGGVIFTGIGFGIVAAGTLLPLLLQGGLTRAWVALGIAGALASAVAWCLLPPDAPRGVDGGVGLDAPAGRIASPGQMGWLVAAYATSAAGQVPVILFLADFAARGLHLGVAGGSALWAWAGVGALIGPLLAGAAADRLGHAVSLRVLWLSQIVANAMLLGAAWRGGAPFAAIALAAAVAGAGIPGLVVLVLGRSQVLAGPASEARSRAWSRATIGFAMGQATGAYGLSALFTVAPSYAVLFAAAVACMAVALVAGECADGPRWVEDGAVEDAPARG